MTFQAAATLWHRTNVARYKGATAVKYENLLRSHILPELGARQLEEINTLLLADFMNAKLHCGRLDHSGGLSSSYVRSMMLLVLDIMEFAAAEGLCPPVKTTLQTPAANRREVVILDTDALRRLETYLLAMARVYVNIGSFYRDITTDITEASDKGKYKPFFDNIRELLDTVATDENESEIVRLELLELSRSALQQYATKFKGDGISQADMMQMYDQVERTVTGISATADTTEHKKEATVSLLADTKKAIETAYATKGGKQA